MRVSLPVRGAWIEMGASSSTDGVLSRRSPCGERGLKLLVIIWVWTWCMSLPVRGAWIEIDLFFAICHTSNVAPRAGSVD